ncbi:MAG: PhoD-like phosphatase [Synechococcales cyanobacterium M58_A2018_015]|nr:PhoD-like phosphatase [Synechococcales cyanobacterium M58_A2018_015]
MTWTPLSERLPSLPLILAGPILRKADSMTVTVWLALRRACTVSLQIYATHYGNGLELSHLLLEATQPTVAIGKHLHLVAVTAYAQTPILESDQIYAYDLVLQDSSGSYTLQQALDTENTGSTCISYFPHRLPTFALPPHDLNALKLVHGSCRKPHGGGVDVMPIVDDLIEQHASQPRERPHQLFFTGDQIYGDDVADPLLLALTEAGDTLLGWQEILPIDKPDGRVPPLYAQHLPPGERSNIAENLGGFTAGLRDKPENTKSHLFSFGEYCSSYLFAWSPVLWPEGFPQGPPYRDGKRAKQWTQEVAALQTFLHPLWKVRRALANIPTYMVFDDHDISDDWYLNLAWCLRVLGKPLGRRTVQNGLLAYALFQAWGNTPEQFEPSQPGAELLEAAQAWSATAGTDRAAAETIARVVGLPPADPETGLPQFRRDEQTWILDRDPGALTWHYIVRGPHYEVLVLDTRTWRGYPISGKPTAPPMLLSPTAFDRQIRHSLQPSGTPPPEQTLVIAPTNLIHLSIIDKAQELSLKQGKVFHNDVGDAWNMHKEALSELLAALFEHRRQVVVLSGDIHYGFAAQLYYWTRPQPTSPDEIPHVLVQLTSSALKNAEWKTQIIHTKLKSLAPEQPQDWLGWWRSPELIEVQITPGRWRTVKLEVEDQVPLIRQIQTAAGSEALSWLTAVRQPQFLPDWRYRIEWIKRQPAQPAFNNRRLPWLQAARPIPRGWQRRLTGLSWLWRNRWLQEGEEVVGYNNFGIVQFRHTPTTPPVVLQDLYWCPPWNPDCVVTSRFCGSLIPQDGQPPIPVLRE